MSPLPPRLPCDVFLQQQLVLLFALQLPFASPLLGPLALPSTLLRLCVVFPLQQLEPPFSPRLLFCVLQQERLALLSPLQLLFGVLQQERPVLLSPPLLLFGVLLLGQLALPSPPLRPCAVLQLLVPPFSRQLYRLMAQRV